MCTAYKLRHFALAEPMWLLMEQGHWSALLPMASETSGRTTAGEDEERKEEGASSDTMHVEPSVAVGKEKMAATIDQKSALAHFTTLGAKVQKVARAATCEIEESAVKAALDCARSRRYGMRWMRITREAGPARVAALRSVAEAVDRVTEKVAARALAGEVSVVEAERQIHAIASEGHRKRIVSGSAVWVKSNFCAFYAPPKPQTQRTSIFDHGFLFCTTSRNPWILAPCAPHEPASPSHRLPSNDRLAARIGLPGSSARCGADADVPLCLCTHA